MSCHDLSAKSCWVSELYRRWIHNLHGKYNSLDSAARRKSRTFCYNVYDWKYYWPEFILFSLRSLAADEENVRSCQVNVSSTFLSLP